ncbi:CheY chemotaxis protein or a CheY-like REC (receiver) domain [Parelusimicrobium proximum]|uniref:response regulator n=1 Tax=Parelusimicrobium proximum TaxID=3228953 RepID=UPI003D16348E
MISTSSKNLKRFISAAVIACFLTTMLPTSAFSETPLENKNEQIKASEAKLKDKLNNAISKAVQSYYEKSVEVYSGKINKEIKAYTHKHNIKLTAQEHSRLFNIMTEHYRDLQLIEQRETAMAFHIMSAKYRPLSLSYLSSLTSEGRMREGIQDASLPSKICIGEVCYKTENFIKGALRAYLAYTDSNDIDTKTRYASEILTLMDYGYADKQDILTLREYFREIIIQGGDKYCSEWKNRTLPELKAYLNITRAWNNNGKFNKGDAAASNRENKYRTQKLCENVNRAVTGLGLIGEKGKDEEVIYNFLKNNYSRRFGPATLLASVSALSTIDSDGAYSYMEEFLLTSSVRDGFRYGSPWQVIVAALSLFTISEWNSIVSKWSNIITGGHGFYLNDVTLWGQYIDEEAADAQNPGWRNYTDSWLGADSFNLSMKNAWEDTGLILSETEGGRAILEKALNSNLTHTPLVVGGLQSGKMKKSNRAKAVLKTLANAEFADLNEASERRIRTIARDVLRNQYSIVYEDPQKDAAKIESDKLRKRITETALWSDVVVSGIFAGKIMLSLPQLAVKGGGSMAALSAKLRLGTKPLRVPVSDYIASVKSARAAQKTINAKGAASNKISAMPKKASFKQQKAPSKSFADLNTLQKNIFNAKVSMHYLMQNAKSAFRVTPVSLTTATFSSAAGAAPAKIPQAIHAPAPKSISFTALTAPLRRRLSYSTVSKAKETPSPAPAISLAQKAPRKALLTQGKGILSKEHMPKYAIASAIGLAALAEAFNIGSGSEVMALASGLLALSEKPLDNNRREEAQQIIIYTRTGDIVLNAKEIDDGVLVGFRLNFSREVRAASQTTLRRGREISELADALSKMKSSKYKDLPEIKQAEILLRGGIIAAIPEMKAILSDYSMPVIQGKRLPFDKSKFDWDRLDTDKIAQIKGFENMSKKEAIISFTKSVLKGKKILIINDQLPNAKEIAQQFAGTGAVIKTAHSGKEGAELLKLGNIDIVISDIFMPGVSGHDIAREFGTKGMPVLTSSELATAPQYSSMYNNGWSGSLPTEIRIDEAVAAFIYYQQTGVDASFRSQWSLNK